MKIYQQDLTNSIFLKLSPMHRSLNTRINTNIPDFNATELHVTPTVIPPKNLSSSSKWLDLALFLMTGGREHSETEEREL